MKYFFFMVLLLTSKTFAQNNDFFIPDPVKKTIKAVAISGAMRIDGRLNESEWSLTQPSSRFIQVEPYQNLPPNFETDIRVLYNRQYLYLGITSFDSAGKKAIRATDFKRDFDFRQQDLVSLAFDAFNDERNAISFATNAYGVQRDLLSFDDLYYDVDWNGLWQVRTNRTDSGWTAEIAIPWQTLRYPKTDSLQSWGFNVYRNRRLTNEITAFSAFPRSYSSLRMNYAGILTNLKPPPPKTNIRLQPYVLTSYDNYKGFDSSLKPKETNVKAGGEIKWAISPNAVLDLTANTDFAQVDLDQQVNNITRFSVFFPEKRQFFLENASLFAIGVGPSDDGSGGSMRLQPFFSRRIGLNDDGNPIPIDAGGRFVYRSAKLNYGAIVMRQRGSGGLPATNFFVGRFSKNFGGQNRFGALVTVKDNALSTNIVSTIDGFFRLGESQSLNTMLVHSTSTKGGRQGFAGIAQYYNITNTYKIWLTESVVTRHFNPGTGFVSRTDVISTNPGIFYYYRGKRLPFRKWLRAFEPGLAVEFYHQASTGTLIERHINFYPFYLNLVSGAYIGYGPLHSYQRLAEGFDPLGVHIAPGSYTYFHHLFLASTDPSKILSLLVQYNWGGYFNGKLNTGDWSLQFAPIPHISVIGKFNRNRFIKVGEAQTNTTVDLYSIQGRFALDPRLQLTALYQKNSQDRLTNYNIRLSWEYRPLSYIYMVFNHQSFTGLQLKPLSEGHAIAKVSYLKQF